TDSHHRDYYSSIMVSERFQQRVERLLEEADQAIARYDWEAVRQAAQAVLAIDPENSDGMAFFATVERTLGLAPRELAPPSRFRLVNVRRPGKRWRENR
ncbi:MAG: hypothetical protein ACE1Y2_05850, partial [Stenotrophomonas maltophilia]